MKITGTVKNYNSAEIIPFATIYESDAAGNLQGSNGTTADAGGYYTIDAAPGSFITARIVGTLPQTKKIEGDSIDFQLQSKNFIPEITVQSKRTYILPTIAALFILYIIANKKSR